MQLLYKVHVFLKLFHVLWCMLLMFYLFWQQCALICSVVFDYFYIYVDLQSMFIDQNVDLGSIWGVWSHDWYHKKHNFMLLEIFFMSIVVLNPHFSTKIRCFYLMGETYYWAILLLLLFYHGSSCYRCL